MFKKYKIPLLSLALLFGVILSVYFFEQTEPPPLEFESNLGVPVLSPPIALPSVTLIDQNNTPVKTTDLQGGWSLMFFGFTNCPDICPTTLMSMNQVSKRLPQESIRYVFVSLDPERDTPEKMKEYVSFFNPEFIGLTGKKADIDQLSEALGIIYDYEGDVNAGKYTVNHYAAILVIDPKARVRAHILPPHPIDKVVNATNRLMDYYGN